MSKRLQVLLQRRLAVVVAVGCAHQGVDVVAGGHNTRRWAATSVILISACPSRIPVGPLADELEQLGPLLVRQVGVGRATYGMTTWSLKAPACMLSAVFSGEGMATACSSPASACAESRLSPGRTGRRVHGRTAARTVTGTPLEAVVQCIGASRRTKPDIGA